VHAVRRAATASATFRFTSDVIGVVTLGLEAQVFSSPTSMQQASHPPSCPRDAAPCQLGSCKRQQRLGVPVSQGSRTAKASCDSGKSGSGSGSGTGSGMRRAATKHAGRTQYLVAIAWLTTPYQINPSRRRFRTVCIPRYLISTRSHSGVQVPHDERSEAAGPSPPPGDAELGSGWPHATTYDAVLNPQSTSLFAPLVAINPTVRTCCQPARRSTTPSLQDPPAFLIQCTLAHLAHLAHLAVEDVSCLRSRYLRHCRSPPHRTLSPLLDHLPAISSNHSIASTNTQRKP
jgi:hypothetical protein